MLETTRLKRPFLLNLGSDIAACSLIDSTISHVEDLYIKKGACLEYDAKSVKAGNALIKYAMCKCTQYLLREIFN